MTDHRPFREVKLQWLQQLSCDKDLSDNARSVALYIVTTHMNGHTEKAWPSYQTIADATGKSVKTIQRAIGELEDKEWLDVRRGNGTGHNTEYRPSALSILRASEAREKTDRIVTLRPDEGGQICPPNPEKEKIYKPNAREEAQSRPERQSAVPLVFVPATRTVQIDHWRSWLKESQLPDIEALSLKTVVGGRSGYSLPSYWPPGDATAGRLSTIAFLRQRHDHLANRFAGQASISRAS